jgi:methyl-accepting chemotaxis protein
MDAGETRRGWIDRDALRETFGGAMLRRSIAVALVVGTILNAINQGPEILAGLRPQLFKMVLTYAVPFLVSSFGAYSALRGRKAKADCSI